MTKTRAALLPSQLSEATFPRFRDELIAAEASGVTHSGRSYPGVPRVALPRPRSRLMTSFDAVVARRRSARSLETRLPDETALARLLALGHGVTGPERRGPSPSAGNLQPIELYLLVFADGWIRGGAHHYDRAEHALSDLDVPCSRESLVPLFPSLAQVEGGAALLVLVGDSRSVDEKYGDRAPRFLLLEAGHVMQSLTLAAASVGAVVVPIGGFLEDPIAAHLRLPSYDAVLYCGVLGVRQRG